MQDVEPAGIGHPKTCTSAMVKHLLVIVILTVLPTVASYGSSKYGTFVDEPSVKVLSASTIPCASRIST